MRPLLPYNPDGSHMAITTYLFSVKNSRCFRTRTKLKGLEIQPNNIHRYIQGFQSALDALSAVPWSREQRGSL